MKKNSKETCNGFGNTYHDLYTNVVSSGTLTLSALKKAFNSIVESPCEPTHVWFDRKLYKIGSKKFNKAIKDYYAPR